MPVTGRGVQIMNINKFTPYIIGETAYNHEGDIKYLFRMINEISEIGLNAVKFHLLLNPESYMQKKHPLMEKIKEWTFAVDQWHEIINHSYNKGLDIIALTDDIESVTYAIENNPKVSAIEIHASGLNDYFLLKKAAEFNGTIILGIGGSLIDEITYAVDLLKSFGKKEILLMYGFQSYPTVYTSINLSKMLTVSRLFNLPVGYADHTAFDDPNNEIVSVMGAMMGVNILEKHYTPDYGKERIDYHAAIGKQQMLKIKELMKLSLSVFGDNSLKMSEAELAYGNVGPMKKAIVARRVIRKGEVLSLDNLWFKRTVEESYLRQSQFTQLIGLKAIRDIGADEIVDFSNVQYEFKKADLAAFTHITQDEVKKQ